MCSIFIRVGWDKIRQVAQITALCLLENGKLMRRLSWVSILLSHNEIWDNGKAIVILKLDPLACQVEAKLLSSDSFAHIHPDPKCVP